MKRAWHTHGYYGSVSHNVKAIYQRYMGWYDGNPARLWQHPPKAAAEAVRRVHGRCGRRRRQGPWLGAAGDLRWAAQVLDHVVFAEPDHAAGRDTAGRRAGAARASAARTAPGAAPTSPGRWNCGPATSAHPPSPHQLTSSAQLTPELFFDAVAIQVNGPAAWDLDLAIRWDYPDHDEVYRTTLHNGVFSYVQHQSGPVDLTVTVPRAALGPLAVGNVPAATAGGLILDGDGSALEQLLSVLEPGDTAFNIVEP